MTKPLPYCELHAHSAFSFLEGAAEPESLAEQAQRLGLPAVALVDRGGVYGLPRFTKACREAGIEAMAGAEVCLEDGSRLPLLVEDARGWSNLCRLLTTAALGYPKGKGRATWQQLRQHTAGLFALTGWEEGPLVRTWRHKGVEAAAALLSELVDAFGREHVAVEVCRQLVRGEERLIGAVVGLARRHQLPLVATTNALLAREEDGVVADCFTCLREKTTLDHAGRLLAPNRSRVLRSPQAMAALFAELPQAVANTVTVAQRCGFRLSQLPYRFPQAQVGAGKSEAEELRERVWAGARERYRQLTERVRCQLERELQLIEKLSLCGYFLVVHDIVRFCQREQIMVQGRGSAANSAVCYALSITNVDPIAYDLLFERFLSEERGEWPDIDLDLPSGEQREKVIQYVYRTYGERGAGMTAVVVSYRGRAAVREAGKVLGFDPQRVEKLSAMLSGWGFERDPRQELPHYMRAVGLDPEEVRGRRFVDLVTRLVGLPRHLGQHTGGMVLAAGRLDEVVPLEPATMPGRVVIQWDKDDCADLGIIKVDLLGLGMMQVLELAAPLVRQHQGVEVDYAHLPPDDPAVYAMLCQADTVGVFQVESRAQMATLPRMRPQRFYDLVVEVAIIRPGPIVGNMVHPYLNRRMGREPVTYPHPDLRPILERTLGVPLFQEQLMRVAMVAAGFSGGQAEELRRAMGAKRSVERMQKLERQLREGMAARGITGEAADAIVHGITSFALYGFPESHAASFALIAYASAYLKVHHPEAFYCALLSAWPMGFYHPATIVQDARRHGVRVLPVDVNHSQWLCTLERDQQQRLAVRLGFKFVKGLRREAAEQLRREAQKKPFANLQELLRRGGLNRRELEVLASIGACASLGASRRSALWQVGAFDGHRRPLEKAMGWDTCRSPLPEMSLEERYVADFSGTGLTVGRHPLHLYRAYLQRQGILAAQELTRVPHGRRVRVGGVVIVRQRPSTAKGMCFATLEDETGFANVVFTPDLFAQHRATITTATLLEVEGVSQSRDGVITVRATAVRPLALPTPTYDSRDFH
ncbi:MAG: error-prone DNA polymerase [Thermoanaerobaculum sp.]|nr:error-prone DNA polymerase [Thermoanaerobaculum sp.]MDW7967768.1 error-prone DNA polymerase [Thermoanaerobaculum sp.]